MFFFLGGGVDDNIRKGIHIHTTRFIFTIKSAPTYARFYERCYYDPFYIVVSPR